MRSHRTIQNNLLSRTQEFFKKYPKIVVEVMTVRKSFVFVITKKKTNQTFMGPKDIFKTVYGVINE